MSNMIEQRRRERLGVEQFIEVIDALAGEEVGRVINIHEDGFLVIGNGQIRENCLYQLVMNFSHPVEAKESIAVGAECLWLKTTDSGNQYWAGFQIIDIDENDRALIPKLVEAGLCE